MSLLLNSGIFFFSFVFFGAHFWCPLLVPTFGVCRRASSHGRVGSDAANVVGVERHQTSGRAFGSTCGACTHVRDGLVVDIVHA